MRNGAVKPEAARSILDDLIRQQRLLRLRGADPDLLEANRLGIVYWQGHVDRKRPRRRTPSR